MTPPVVILTVVAPIGMENDEDHSSSSDDENAHPGSNGHGPSANGSGDAGQQHMTLMATMRNSANEARPVSEGRGRGRGRGGRAGRGSSGGTNGQAANGRGRPSTVPALPPPPLGRPRPMVRNEPSTDIPESYTQDEKSLNEFLKLHPMLSLGKATPESHPSC